MTGLVQDRLALVLDRHTTLRGQIETLGDDLDSLVDEGVLAGSDADRMAGRLGFFALELDRLAEEADELRILLGLVRRPTPRPAAPQEPPVPVAPWWRFW